MARDAFCTPDHFTRGFAARFGTTPKRYVLLRKVDLACLMLRDTNYSIERIAQQLSFVDTQHLSRHFRAVVGVTPGAYRGEAVVGGQGAIVGSKQ
jgi:AraC-like DNA-binding protein